MIDFDYRDLANWERWGSDFEQFVAQISDGYSMSIYEYANDLGCRQLLEENRVKPEVQGVWNRVDKADDFLRPILIPTKRCFHGDNPRSWYWFWGYPPNSPELEDDLRSIGAI